MNRILVILLVLSWSIVACGRQPTTTADGTATGVAAATVAAVSPATEVGVPSSTPSAAATATSTPAPSSTLQPSDVPTATAEPPTPVPGAMPNPRPSPTPTLAPTATEAPTVTPHPTATRELVAATRKPRASATPRPTLTVVLFAAPKLLLPVPEDTLADHARFQWQWDGPALPEGYAFDLRIWSEREEKAGAVPRGAVEVTRKTEAEVWLEFVPAMEFGEGLYYWTVVVVRATKPPKVVGQWGERRWFIYRLPTPTPTETPEPTEATQ